MGFFKLYKPRTYDYRYIYYDPKKEAQKEREKRLNGNQSDNNEFKSNIRRGTFREQANMNRPTRKGINAQSNLRLIIIITILLALVYYLLR
jgi:hypothetical protein